MQNLFLLILCLILQKPSNKRGAFHDFTNTLHDHLYVSGRASAPTPRIVTNMHHDKMHTAGRASASKCSKAVANNHNEHMYASGKASAPTPKVSLIIFP